jgi:hypothetical protein
MRTLWIAVGVLLATASTGCSVYFHGSAPASEGGIYVVGAKQGFMTTKSTVWLCPVDGTQAKCEKVEVVRE